MDTTVIASPTEIGSSSGSEWIASCIIVIAIVRFYVVTRLFNRLSICSSTRLINLLSEKSAAMLRNPSSTQSKSPNISPQFSPKPKISPSRHTGTRLGDSFQARPKNLMKTSFGNVQNANRSSSSRCS